MPRITSNQRRRPLWLLPALAVLAAGCDSLPKMGEVVRDRQVEYRSSRAEPSLEVPPDLTSASIQDSMVVPDVSGTATYSEYAGASDAASRGPTGVLVIPDGVEVAREGDKRWLVLEGPPSRYWSRVRDFWLDQGLLIQVENPEIGIMETDWAENRADIPRDFIRNTIGKVFDSLYSTATRDKYRVRFERGSRPDTTEIYITHRGAEEVVRGEAQTVWQPRPSDPELEAEMLHRLIVFLGVKEERAQRMMANRAERKDRATMAREQGGGQSLVLLEPFDRAWRRTGLALDRVGFTVEDRDRSRGLYFVRYVDPLADDDKDSSLLSRLKFWGDGDQERRVEYLISLVEGDGRTRVDILDTQGNRDTGDTADRILNLLYEQLR